MPSAEGELEVLPSARVLVLRDIMLDRYTWGRAERVSPEAPVLVLKAENCEVRLGGAGAVAGLLRGLDSEVLLAGVVGDDPEGRTVGRLVEEAGIDGRLVQTDADRPTTHKHRVLASVEQRQPHQVLRLDHERTEFLTAEVGGALVEAIGVCAGLRPTTAGDQACRESGSPAIGGLADVGRPAPNRHIDVVLISDYAKGVCTPELLARVIGAAREQGVPVAIDPARIGDYERYRGATLVKPNRREAEGDGILIGRNLGGQGIRFRTEVRAVNGCYGGERAPQARVRPGCIHCRDARFRSAPNISTTRRPSQSTPERPSLLVPGPQNGSTSKKYGFPGRCGSQLPSPAWVRSSRVRQAGSVA